MVRHYVRKNTKKKSYDQDNLKRALEEIERGLSVRAASKTYSIPFSTLLHAKKGTRSLGKQAGRPTSIPDEDEKKLANGLRTLEKWGWGLSRKEVLDLVGAYVRKNNIKTPFKEGYPGEDWFLGFKKRHHLSIKKPQSLEYARKKATDPFIIYNYFDLLEKTINELNLSQKPKQIYNIDETSFCLDPSKTKVVGETNKPSSRIVSGPGRENTTVLFGANAAGDKLPPLVVFQGKNMWDTWMAPNDKAFPNTSYAASANGWMESDIFLNYIKKTFLQHCVPERPILLIYDGHSTHLGTDVLSLAVENSITIIKLPAHSSHLLQPLDLAVYKSMKSRWDSKLSAYQRRHIGVKVPKREFSVLVGEVWTETDSNIIKQGFNKGGVHPLNKKAVDRNKFDPESLKRYEALQIIDSSSESSTHTQTQTSENTMFEVRIPRPSTSSMTHEEALRLQEEDIDDPAPNNSIVMNLEDLLLQTVKQSPITQKTTKKKVASGAEVLTEPDVIERLRKKEHEAKKEKEKRKKSKKFNRNKDAKMNKIVKVKKIKQEKPWKKAKSKIQRKTGREDEDTDHELNMKEISDSDDDISTVEDLAKYISDGEDEGDYLEMNVTYKIGDWVLVSFATKKVIKHYVAQIIDFIDEEPVVKCTRKKNQDNETVFVWPEKDDISRLNMEDILVHLPEPILGRREELKFKVSFASYNIQ